MKQLNILVIGTGMYACGRGTNGHGTVMPAVLEWKRKNRTGNLYIAGKDIDGTNVAKAKIDTLKRDMNIEIPLKYFPDSDEKKLVFYEEAIREIPKPACAIIVVPDHLHREIAGRTIENGLHTFVVKPLTPTIKEVQELIGIQKASRVYCAVEFHKRFDHANLKLKDAISQGSIGDPLYFLVEYSQRKSVPSERFIKWINQTNPFQYLGIHYLDIIYFVTNAVPKRAMALGQKGWLASKGIDTYDSIQGIIEWEMPSGKKFSSHILTNWVDPEKTSAMSEQKIKVIGTKGRFESDQKKRGITMVTDEKGVEEPNPYFCSAYGKSSNVSYHGYGIDSILRFLNDVVQIENGMLRIEDLEDNRPTFKQSIVPTAALEAINRSLSNNGEWVTIEGV